VTAMPLYARDLYQMEKHALAVLRLRVFLAWLRSPLGDPVRQVTDAAARTAGADLRWRRS
jgi:hypothetical protein